ncbi:hypothetical protein DKM19_04760 [Streptosporangium sp. 'caverna']|nr:hypothetical protein DKM19_04760 [Streptosporangium sp. 'caverna']
MALAGSCLLTACGGADSGGSAAAKDDGVASIVGESPGEAAGSGSGTANAGSPKKPAADAKRPQLRLDSSPEEITKYRQAYATCLKNHGMPAKTNSAPSAAALKAAEASTKACEDKVPLQPPEMDPKKNPHYADDVRAQVKCMKGYGFKVRVVPATGSDPNAVSWTYDSIPGDGVDIEKIQDECRVKAFGGG